MSVIPASDKAILRELARQIAQAAALPVMDERRGLWRRLNALKPIRPMVIIEQVCWCEMNVNDELTLRCENPECREYERWMRKTLYHHNYMPDDRVIEPYLVVHKAITGGTAGIESIEETLSTDEANIVLSRHYVNQFTCMEDIEKIKMPIIRHDTAETERRLAVAHELFDGVIDIRAEGDCPGVSVWDNIAMWMGVENALYALSDEPEMMFALVSRMVAFYGSMFDQLEEQGLLCPTHTMVHCSGAWTDELPKEGYNPEKPRLKDIWTCGLAQMLGSCSPQMLNEYEIEPCAPLFERFGLVYYGCCESLDNKLDSVKNIPNLRKISASPWSHQETFAEQIGGGYVMSRKPNPALVAFESFDGDLIRADLMKTKEICTRYGSPFELILKDLSTVRYQPQRLWKWAEIAMEVVCS